MHAVEEGSPSSLQTFVSRYYKGLTTRFSGCGDGDTFIACLDINEKHVSLDLVHFPSKPVVLNKKESAAEVWEL